MALATAMIWEVRPDASDNNGGGFKSGASGTDRSQQVSAHATLTAASTVHTTTTQVNVAVGDYTVTAADVGNLLQVTGGTAMADFYEITAADTVNNRWTVDKSVGTAGQTVVGAMGGAVATPGKIGAKVVNGNIVFLKSGVGTHSITSASNNVAGGCFSTAQHVLWVGYSTNRTFGNTDVAPTLQLNAATATIAGTGASSVFYNIVFDGNSQTTSKVSTGSSIWLFCTIKNFTANALQGGMAYHCSFTGNSASVTANASTEIVESEAYANTVTPFSGGRYINCLSYGNTGATTDGFLINNAGTYCLNCSAYGNGRDGFRITNSTNLVNCHSEGNVAFGFNNASSGIHACLVNCSTFGNGSGALNGILDAFGTLTPTASVFNNPGGNDLSLNFGVGGGAVLRNAGFPTTFHRGTTPTFPNIGATVDQVSKRGGLSVESRPRPFAPGLAH